eukprot:COSAG01_NODE_33568_length_562_cov_0.768898_3_plen_43_part_01
MSKHILVVAAGTLRNAAVSAGMASKLGEAWNKGWGLSVTRSTP